MRSLLLAVPLALLLALLVASCDADSGIRTWLALRGELRDGRERIAEIALRNEQLRAEVAALERGGFAVERAIREELRLARPDETLFVLRAERSNPRFP